MGNSVVLSDGTLASLFGVLRDANDPETGWKGFQSNAPNKPTAWIKLITSTDGGRSLRPSVTIDDWYLEPRSPGALHPQLAADQSDSPFKDRLYAAWTDFRTGRLEIWSAYSGDRGTTWSKSRVINDDRIAADPATRGPDAMTPIVAVNKRGVVGVAWYDRRDSPDNLGWYERFSASLDGGETWLPSVRVSEQPNSYAGSELWSTQVYPTGDSGSFGWPQNLKVSVDGFFYSGGHTGAMAVDGNGVFYPFWVDNRTGVAQIWTAPVTVAGAAVKNGSADLAVLEDVTARVRVDLEKTTYDRRTNQLTVIARLKNTSKDAMLAPVKVRVIRIASDVGVPVLVGSDNGQAGPGAVLDFSGLLRNGMLLPDSSCEAKRVVFRLTDLRPFHRGGNEFKFGLIDLDARVFAKRLKAQSDQGARP